jgi:hypothetical protein
MTWQKAIQPQGTQRRQMRQWSMGNPLCMTCAPCGQKGDEKYGSGGGFLWGKAWTFKLQNTREL